MLIIKPKPSKPKGPHDKMFHCPGVDPDLPKRKRGRPAGVKSEKTMECTLQIRISGEDMEFLRMACQSTGESMTDFVRRLIRTEYKSILKGATK